MTRATRFALVLLALGLLAVPPSSPMATAGPAIAVHPSAGFGTVQGYVTPANALVLWDGSPVGVGTNGFFSIAGTAGVAHNLTGNASGYYNETVFVTPVAGSTVWQNLTLRIGNGTVEFFVTPYDSSVTFSGIVIALDAVGEARIDRLPGSYPLTVSHTEYQSVTMNVTLTPFEVLPLDVALKPLASRGGVGPTTVPPPSGPSLGEEVALFGGVAAIGAVATVAVYLDHRRRAAAAPDRTPRRRAEDDARSGRPLTRRQRIARKHRTQEAPPRDR